MTIPLLLCAGGLAPGARAQGFDGRYLLSLLHNEQPGQKVNDLLNLIDATNRSPLTQSIELDLGASLRYEAQPWSPNRSITDTDILRSRLFGDVRGDHPRTAWRLHGQVVPWQRLQPSPGLPARRDVQLGLDFLPRNLPHLFVSLTRADRETVQGISSSDDRRADLRFSRGNFGANAGVRHIESRAPGSVAAIRTEEFHGGVLGSQAWRGVALNGSYDAVVLNTGIRERSIDQMTHNLNAGAVWSPHRKVTLTGSGLTRWLRVEDNGRPAPDDTRELTVSFRADTRPATGLSLGLLREYRESQIARGHIVSDFLRFEGIYRHDIVRSTQFQTGVLQTLDLHTEGGSLPNSSAFALVDGRLHRGIDGRAELRFATTEPASSGLQWRGLLQARTRPGRNTQLDVLWHVDQLPEIEGAQQRDRSWEFVFGYQPTENTNFTGTHRRLDGEGRIERAERFWSLNGSWRTTQYSTLSLYASTRSTRLQSAEAEETIVGTDLAWLATEDLRIRGTWRQVRGSSEGSSYGVILTRSF